MKLYADDFQRARKYLADHEATARRSRAFDFRKPGTSNYAYSLTWTAGSLALAGDCGELTITHYDALRELKDGLRWAAGSDYDYLLSKTSLRQTYDGDATAQEIVRTANAEALDAVKAYRDDVRDWRRSKPDFYQWHDNEMWLEDETSMPAWEENRPERPKVEFRERSRQMSYERHNAVGDWLAPDGWAIWLRLWKRFSYNDDPNCIFSRDERWRISQELERECGEQGRAVEIIYDLGMDDYYGEMRWTFSDLLKIECIRKGATDALEVLRNEEFEADPYGWTDRNFWGGTLPPRSAFVDWLIRCVMSEMYLTYDFLTKHSASGSALEGAERILRDALDAASGGYNQAHNFVHTPGRYGMKGLDWSPEGAARMVSDWLADSTLFWSTDETDLPDDFDYGVEPLAEEAAA